MTEMTKIQAALYAMPAAEIADTLRWLGKINAVGAFAGGGFVGLPSESNALLDEVASWLPFDGDHRNIRVRFDKFRNDLCATPPPAPAADPFQVPKLPGNWPEDASHENGSYECKCWTCGMPFYGHKRRVVCKVCAPTEAPAAEQGDALAEQYRKGWEAGHATAHRIRNALATQPEARGVEGMVLVPSGVMKRIERDYEEWGKTAFAAYVRDLLAAEQTESRWNFAGIDLAPDLLRLVGIKNAIGANPDGQACFDSAASELARKMLNEFQKQWTDCAPLNTPNNREK